VKTCFDKIQASQTLPVDNATDVSIFRKGYKLTPTIQRDPVTQEIVFEGEITYLVTVTKTLPTPS